MRHEDAQLALGRARPGRGASATAAGADMSQVPDAAIAAMVAERARSFLEDAPTTAAEAATIMLDGVKAERWRILVGDDAHKLDEWVRKDPEQAYEPKFYEDFSKAAFFQKKKA